MYNGEMMRRETNLKEEEGSLLKAQGENPKESSTMASVSETGHRRGGSGSYPSTGISSWEAGVSLGKAIMGAGSFSLPWAFSKMGYVGGPLFMTGLMWLSVQTMQWLIQVAKVHSHTASGTTSSTTTSAKPGSSYVEVARATFGSTGARLAYLASLSSSMGVCGSYLIFIAATLQSLFATGSSTPTTPEGGGSALANLSQTNWILLILPLVVLLSSVRDMKRFSVASLLGDVSVVLGMLVVVVYGLFYHSSTTTTNTNTFHKDCVAFASWEMFPLAFGAIGYLFLVHFLVLPIESSMAHPEDFGRVATRTFRICAVVSGGFGILGYLCFGPSTHQIVLLNIEASSSWFLIAVKVLLCADLLLTYPVVMRPSILIVERGLVEGSTGTSATTSTTTTTTTTPMMHGMVCAGLGMIATAGAIFVPAFGLLSGLVGGVSQTFLALVLPPLMKWQTATTTTTTILPRLLQKSSKHPAHSSSLMDMSWNILRSSGLEVTSVFLGTILIVWTLQTTWKELHLASSEEETAL